MEKLHRSGKIPNKNVTEFTASLEGYLSNWNIFAPSFDHIKIFQGRFVIPGQEQKK